MHHNDYYYQCHHNHPIMAIFRVLAVLFPSCSEGLASHWPCVTDFSGLSTYGLTA